MILLTTGFERLFCRIYFQRSWITVCGNFDAPKFLKNNTYIPLRPFNPKANAQYESISRSCPNCGIIHFDTPLMCRPNRKTWAHQPKDCQPNKWPTRGAWFQSNVGYATMLEHPTQKFKFIGTLRSHCGTIHSNILKIVFSLYVPTTMCYVGITKWPVGVLVSSFNLWQLVILA